MTTSPVQDRDAETTKIRAIIDRASAAQGDPDTLLPLHTVDTAIVNLAGRRVLGRDALAEAMTAALASPLRDVRTSIQVVDVRFPGPDLAIVSCIKEVHDEREEADRTILPSAGALSYVMVRIGVEWRIALSQTTPIQK